MPRDLVQASGHSRGRSLGHFANAWMEYFVRHGPGDVHGQPVRHGQEVYDFVVDCYALEPVGRLLYDSAFLSRPKGCDKSGLAARFALFEGLGPCRFLRFAEGGEVFEDPWELGFRYEYSPGEPMGRPVQDAFVRLLATEEMQTGNVFNTVYVNLTDDGCPLSHVAGVDPGLKWIGLPNGGTIVPSTASAASKDGGLETFSVFDESHIYDNPVLRAMYDTVTRNMRKRKATAGTWYLETTTMFEPGADSVAERSYLLAGQIREGLARSERLLFDHRYGECEDLADDVELRAAIVDAFGEAIEWNDIGALVDEFQDLRKFTNDSRRFFLNAPTASGEAWLAPPEWAARVDVMRIVADRETVVLGFDGSRSRAEGRADATALIGCTVADGHLFEIGVWEQPLGAGGVGWSAPVVLINAAVDSAFARYNVVGMFADPALWESHIAAWEAKFHQRLKVRSTREHPIERWMTGGRSTQTVRALEQFHSAVVDGEISHDGSFALTRHVLNAERRLSSSGMQIRKPHPDRKIDAAVAAVLAWECRLVALSAGLGKRTMVPRRIR